MSVFHKISLASFLSIFFLTNNLNGQESLAYYCDVMANAYEPQHRVFAAKKFNELFHEEMIRPASFSNSFEELKWVSMKYPADRSFRIITWMVQGLNHEYEKYGYIQTANGGLFSLRDGKYGLENLDFETLDAQNWQGALYYNMKEVVDKKGNKYYTLFGYDGFSEDLRRKIIDVLYFEDGVPYFGAPLFKFQKEGTRPIFKNRIYVYYSPEANVNCNYNQGMDLIIHDFVVERSSMDSKKETMIIPDGTYVAFEWNGQHWQHQEKLENTVTKPEDIFFQPKQASNKDLFGRPKKSDKKRQ